MPDRIDALVQHWKEDPSRGTTIALCDALRGPAHGPLVEQVGAFATKRLGNDAAVLLSAGRMYMEAHRYAEAQGALIAAGKLAPRDSDVYRFLGQVLLKRGDADRAEKVLTRAIQLGAQDEDTRLWLEHARVFRPIQAKEGPQAVAAELARTAAEPVRELLDSMSETTTGVIDRPGRKQTLVASPAPPASRPLPPAPAPVLLRPATLPLYSRDDETAPHAIIPRTPAIEAESPSEPDDTEISGRSLLDSGDTEILSASDSDIFSGPVPTGPAVPKRAELPGRREESPPIRRAGPPAAAGALPVPHPRDVLDALELAGMYEPQAAGAVTWSRGQKAPKRKGGATLITGMVLFVGATVGTYYYYRDHRAKDHLQAEAVLATVEAQLASGRLDTLPELERELGRALQLESRSPRASLDWARDRALVGLVKGGEDVAFEDAMTRAKDVGVSEDKYAFARVASFLYQGDTAGAASVMGKWDAAAGKDAWFQLMAGATLERAGDPRARDRYAAAARAAPDMLVAQVALVRSTALDGDPQEAARLAKELRARAPDRAEPVALVALAWGRDPKREGLPAPPEVDDVAKRKDDLPIGLKAVPHAVAALRALDKRAADEARAEVQKGLAVADSPGVAVWLGGIALPLGDEALARKAALAALQMSAAYTPARSLAARVALLGDRLDEALKATEELDAASPDVAVVRAAAAYERMDVDGVSRSLEALSPEARKMPFLGALDLGPDVLAGKLHLDGGKLVIMAADDAPWSELVAMDAALDDGDLATADKIAASWGKDAESQALRALRLARLARYEGRLDAADALSQTTMERGTVTPRALVERAFTLVARSRSAEVAPLIVRYPLVLGPLASWLAALATASGGNVDAAKAKTASLDPPPAGTPLEMRVVAAAALGAMKDKRRGGEYVKDVLATGSLSPDLVVAALSLGFRKVDHGRRRPTYE